MSYYLEVPESAYVDVPNAALAYTGYNKFSFDFELNTVPASGPSGVTVIRRGNATPQLEIHTGGDYVWFNNGEQITMALTAGVRYLFEAIRISGKTYEFYLDGALVGTPTDTTSESLFFDELFFANGVSFKVYRFQVYDAADALAWDYDPSLSNGSGSVLTDSVNGNNGTLVGFPTDDSQWVFYSDEPAPSLTITNAGDITPGSTLTATASNFTAAPTTISLSDGASPALTPALTATASGDDYDLSALIADFKAQADSAGEGVAVQGLRIGTITATVE